MLSVPPPNSFPTHVTSFAMTILFLHGWRSVAGGVKPTYLARHGIKVINPQLPDEDFAGGGSHRPGGVRPAPAAGGRRFIPRRRRGDEHRLRRLPGWSCSARLGKSGERPRTVRPDAVILHSPADDVIPLAESSCWSRRQRLAARGAVRSASDHRLADEESLAAMLAACEAS